LIWIISRALIQRRPVVADTFFDFTQELWLLARVVLHGGPLHPKYRPARELSRFFPEDLGMARARRAAVNSAA
jgi:hypothetical protein